MKEIEISKRFISTVIGCFKREREREKQGEVDQFVCLFGFYGISTLVGYLIPNPFLHK